MDLNQIKRLFESGDDRAVSPVIGVILMVAITVILAAVIGTFVLGLGSGVQSTPQASFDFDYTDNTGDSSTNDTLKVSHGGGDKIKAQELSATTSSAKNLSSGNEVSLSSNFDLFGSSGKIGAGDSDTLDGSSFNNIGSNGNLGLNESTVKIVFSRSDKPETAILAEFEGPDA